jgi:cytochrome bd-type quinol oxidase subunit 2
MIKFFDLILLAQTNPICPEGNAKLCNPTGAESFQVFLGDIFSAVTVIIGIVTISMVVYSGFRMVISSGNEEELSKAKSSFQWSIAGFILALLAYVIISSISDFIGAREVPAVPGEIENPVESSDLIVLAGTILRGALQIVGLVSLLYIILNGFRYITSRGNEEQASQAKQGLMWAVGGLILAILAYVIVAVVLDLLGHDLYTSGGGVVMPPPPSPNP